MNTFTAKEAEILNLINPRLANERTIEWINRSFRAQVISKAEREAALLWVLRGLSTFTASRVL